MGRSGALCENAVCVRGPAARLRLPRFVWWWVLPVLFRVQAGVDEHRITVEPGPPVTYRYLVKLPDGYREGEDTEWPLVLYLHGGNTPSFRMLDQKTAFLDPLPAIVVAPVCPPSDKGWQYTDWDPRVLGEIVRKVSDGYSVDENRRSVIGFSMGGSAAWELPFHEKGLFGRAVVIAGVAHPWSLRNYPESTAVWVFSGSKDKLFEDQRATVASANRFGVDVVETIWPGMAHGGIYQKAISSRNMLEWLTYREGAVRTQTPPELVKEPSEAE